MKYKIGKEELKEMISEAVVRVLKEDYFDDILNNALASDPKRAKAEKAAQKDQDKEDAQNAKDDAAIDAEIMANTEGDEEDDSAKVNSDISSLSTAELNQRIQGLSKSSAEFRQIASELKTRRRIKSEYEEDGIQPEWGYEIDPETGEVEPTHKDFGAPGAGNASYAGGDFRGLNFGWGHTGADFD